MNATGRFLTRLGRRRDEFLREHFGAAWGWYERLTAICTAGLVHRWRERCVRACSVRPGARLLDVGTGTGSLLLQALPRLGPAGLGVGLDASREGLLAGRTAAAATGTPTRWVQASALPLPLGDGSFDVVLVGFALRHLGAPGAVLAEFRRVLVPGGRLGIIDFLRPRPGLLGWAGFAYLFWIVPVICLALSRRRAVYRLARYLPHSILDALKSSQLHEELRAAGFALEEERSLCAGIVWLFAAYRSGAKPAPTAGDRAGWPEGRPEVPAASSVASGRR
ncbi:MAG: class I SAM-dependent methyltransferase [Candidatus Rokuibacteriota bacterium]